MCVMRYFKISVTLSLYENFSIRCVLMKFVEKKYSKKAGQGRLNNGRRSGYLFSTEFRQKIRESRIRS